VSLNPNILWDFDLNVGAAALNMDLTPFLIKEIMLDAGAASVDIKLGSRSDETCLCIDAGASSISIEVPESSACEIISNAELSSKHFEGFMNVNGKVFRTPNYDTAAKKIRIEIDAGISNIDVRRYSEEAATVVTESEDSLIQENGAITF
jgi:hypothetical protein